MIIDYFSKSKSWAHIQYLVLSYQHWIESNILAESSEFIEGALSGATCRGETSSLVHIKPTKIFFKPIKIISFKPLQIIAGIIQEQASLAPHEHGGEVVIPGGGVEPDQVQVETTDEVQHPHQLITTQLHTRWPGGAGDWDQELRHWENKRVIPE